MCFCTNRKNTTTAKQTIIRKIPCRNLILNLGPFAPKANAIPLHHLVN